jgi:hypothetical protein
LKQNIVFTFSLLVLMALLEGGCGSLLLVRSTALDHDLSLSTDIRDWPGGVTAVGDAVSLGSSNNSDFLFIALVVRDFKNSDDNPLYAHSLAAGGLTVWVDPQGSDHKTFGIHLRGMEEVEDGMPDSGSAVATPSPADQIQSSDLAANGLAITDAKGKFVRTTAAALQTYGFEARTSYSGDRFVYVMKLPLHPMENSPFPSELGKSQNVGFSFEGKDFTAHKQGGGSGGGSGNVSEKFNVWFSDQLASNQPAVIKSK